MAIDQLYMYISQTQGKKMNLQTCAHMKQLINLKGIFKDFIHKHNKIMKQ